MALSCNSCAPSLSVLMENGHKLSLLLGKRCPYAKRSFQSLISRVFERIHREYFFAVRECAGRREFSDLLHLLPTSASRVHIFAVSRKHEEVYVGYTDNFHKIPKLREERLYVLGNLFEERIVGSLSAQRSSYFYREGALCSLKKGNKRVFCLCVEEVKRLGYPKDLFLLAKACSQAGDRKKSYELHRFASNRGSKKAPYEVGIFLEKQGKVQEAAVWYKRGADRGDSAAVLALGRILEEQAMAHEIARREELLVSLLRLYTRHDAKGNEAILKRRGNVLIALCKLKNTQRDYKALLMESIRREEVLFDSKGCFVVGNCFEKGEGGKVDRDEAIRWYQKGRRYSRCLKRVANLKREDEEYEEAQEAIFTYAMQITPPKVKWHVGEEIRLGQWGAPNRERVSQLFLAAAKGKDEIACLVWSRVKRDAVNFSLQTRKEVVALAARGGSRSAFLEMKRHYRERFLNDQERYIKKAEEGATTCHFQREVARAILEKAFEKSDEEKALLLLKKAMEEGDIESFKIYAKRQELRGEQVDSSLLGGEELFQKAVGGDSIASEKILAIEAYLIQGDWDRCYSKLASKWFLKRDLSEE